MSSEDNKMNDSTGFNRSKTGRILCANGCGYFGQAATNNLCSKCFRDLKNREKQEASAKAALDKVVDQFSTRTVDPMVLPPAAVVESGGAAAKQTEAKAVNRCTSCRKKVGILGFKCRCGSTFCGIHRYPEKHECGYDFKAVGKQTIAQANPVVKADKIRKF